MKKLRPLVMAITASTPDEDIIVYRKEFLKLVKKPIKFEDDHNDLLNYPFSPYRYVNIWYEGRNNRLDLMYDQEFYREALRYQISICDTLEELLAMVDESYHKDILRKLKLS